MKNIVLYLSICLAAGMFFANVYTSIVDARSWGSNIPQSIAAARAYFEAANPGDFFRIFSPVNQVLALVALILFWKSSRAIRIFLATALVMYVLTDVMTFAFFYPRNDILFKTAQLGDVETLRKTWSEWSTMNWVRSGVLAVGLVCAFLSLDRLRRATVSE